MQLGAIKLTKSRFIAGVQCPKRLYWQVHEPGLASEATETAVARMEQGHEVGHLACLAFPGGAKVDYDNGNIDQAVRQTRELISNPQVSAIFEATFEYDGVLVRVDILQRRPRNKWRLIEVKSKADLKDYHIYDVAIQKHVVAHCGLDLGSSCLMHLNRTYVYTGGDHDVHRFFRIRNLNRRLVKVEAEIVNRLKDQFEVLSQLEPPDTAPGRQCTAPVECEFFSCCNHPLPTDHVRFLPGIRTKTIQVLTEMGIESVHQIPEDFPMNNRMRIACVSMKSGAVWYGTDLKKELEELRYPLYFMDFETVNPAIPPYAGMRPFDQLPFQWSVHVQTRAGADIKHYEFLAETAADPRRDFIQSLCGILGNSGHIVVYNRPFESQRLADLAVWFPEFAPHIHHFQQRLWDLLPVIRNHVYHPAFAGSFSLKSVLRALVPELSYDNLDIADGAQAGLTWQALVHGQLDSVDRDSKKSALLAYCRQDTFALVQILKNLRSAAGCEA